MGVLVRRALLCGVYVRAPDFGNSEMKKWQQLSEKAST